MSRVFSGIQPSGSIHIGNYAGALQNWIVLQEKYECLFSIVDYHAITVEFDPKLMEQRVFDAALDLLAIGIDPEKSILYVQSAVPEHTELCWLLGCIAPMGELNRMTQFKEKSEQQQYSSLGLFSYPVLQAADILLYGADLVPVGEDQLQHLELTREIARRFNHRFGKVFPEPQPLLTPCKRIMSLNDPESKMSKSVAGSAILLSSQEKEIVKMLKRAVTGVGDEGEIPAGVQNLLTLLETFHSKELAEEYRVKQLDGSIRYSELKSDLTEAILTWLRPVQKRREELLKDPESIWKILDENATKAREQARQRIATVREVMGLRVRSD